MLTKKAKKKKLIVRNIYNREKKLVRHAQPRDGTDNNGTRNNTNKFLCSLFFSWWANNIIL